MKNVKKVSSLFSGVLALIAGFLVSPEAKADPFDGCDGGTFYACGGNDVIDIWQDFRDNCCAGDEITVYDVCEGRTWGFYNAFNGDNCGC